ncbi:lycopene cyclase domain-containing protein [Allobranchiibius sp. CTAmp26]|uniref:lycopene cyclase domain-containing protein n=1 Tax=Allobranchiibius sp. CTAmp26 TaxID=2815214 RepID=UPI001AA14419|nr:lycopene cyclase domain-containing protein [Allobranchiibius sp. CTAmp26]MBO1753947.1 lycopene cyclase domain-containing protein [Allobranchiibius sp. CTAmp26]
MPEYTVSVVVGLVVVVVLELAWLRTGIFRSARYWVSMAIVLGFQVLVDGLLTRGSRPVVAYDDSQNLGIRCPPGIPIEDFGFGFVLCTAVLLGWVQWQRRVARLSADS